MVDFTSISVILTLVFTVLILGLFDVALFFILKRSFPRIFIIALEVLAIVSWIFKLGLLLDFSIGIWTIGVFTFCFNNIGDTRLFISNSLKGQSGIELFRKSSKVAPEAIFDREEMYKKVESAIITLSRQKIGALITFQRHDDLRDVMKNGTILNAPVTSELIQTIFYPGTRLHDGAVVIIDDKIAAASVYFTPTNRPLTGKFGSRHRAAYGISETTDSVTIVVSEETGRISIAFQGELTPVTPDNLLRIFEEDMATAVPESKDNK